MDQQLKEIESYIINLGIISEKEYQQKILKLLRHNEYSTIDWSYFFWGLLCDLVKINACTAPSTAILYKRNNSIYQVMCELLTIEGKSCQFMVTLMKENSIILRATG